MEIFELVIGLLLLGAVFSIFSQKIGAPYPALLALTGAALAFIPGMPVVKMDSELILALFIAPVLLDAAFDASPRDLKANWRPVVSLALGAVITTVAVVAAVVYNLVPGFPVAAAIALGAIVAPPDAVAASTVLRPLKPPQRLLTILEGESLFNDASALLIFRFAVSAAATGAVSGWSVATSFLLVTTGSLVLGLILAKLSSLFLKQVHDVSVTVILQFCTTFAVWIIAEKMHLSGIITVVVFAIALARHSPKFLEANVRVPAWAFWGIAVFVLNVLAFFLIGLQLGPILSKLSSAERLRSGFIALVVLMTVIVVRFAWVFTAVFLRRVTNDDRKKFESTWAGATLVSWSGMRGTVTVAAALALPQDFPYRDLILTSAFGVTLGTLVLQGLTLKPLLEKLNLVQDNSVETEVNEGRKKTIEAALHAIEQSEKSETASLLEKSYRLQLSRNDRPLKEGETSTASTFEKTAVTSLTQHDRHSAVLAAAIKAQRACLQKLREDNAIGEAAFQKIEEELDWLELGWGQILNLNFVR